MPSHGRLDNGVATSTCTFDITKILRHHDGVERTVNYHEWDIRQCDRILERRLAQQAICSGAQIRLGALGTDVKLWLRQTVVIHRVNQLRRRLDGSKEALTGGFDDGLAQRTLSDIFWAMNRWRTQYETAYVPWE